MRNGSVTNLADAAEGLKLALRGRTRLRADLIGFDEQPDAAMAKSDEVVEDVMWYAVQDVGTRILAGIDGDHKFIAGEVDELLTTRASLAGSLESHPAASEALSWMHETGPVDPAPLVDSLEEQLRGSLEGIDPIALGEYRFSALELLANTLLPAKALEYLRDHGLIFVPRRMEV